jgi:hypothetical protein
MKKLIFGFILITAAQLHHTSAMDGTQPLENITPATLQKKSAQSSRSSSPCALEYDFQFAALEDCIRFCAEHFRIRPIELDPTMTRATIDSATFAHLADTDKDATDLLLERLKQATFLKFVTVIACEKDNYRMLRLEESLTLLINNLPERVPFGLHCVHFTTVYLANLRCLQDNPCFISLSIDNASKTFKCLLDSFSYLQEIKFRRCNFEGDIVYMPDIGVRRRRSRTDFFEKLPHLRSLNFDNCNLGRIPFTAPLVQVKRLQIINDDLRTADFTNFKFLPNLENLVLENCKLTTVPAVAWLEDERLGINAGCTSLKRLSLYFNDLQDADFEPLHMLKELERLNLGYTGIRTIPPVVYELPNLKELLAEFNPIKKETLKSLPGKVDTYSSNLPIIRPPVYFR